MLKLINKIYRKDTVTLDLAEVLNAKLQSLENKINDFYKQIFLNSADWYVSLKELEMSIQKRLNDIDKRRNYVRARLLGVGTATKEMLEGVANSVEGVEVEIGFENMCVLVRFVKVGYNKYLSLVKRSLETMIPYHLDLILEYEHVNWGELRACTWSALLPYTWKSVSESVAGTILGGLDDDFD